MFPAAVNKGYGSFKERTGKIVKFIIKRLITMEDQREKKLPENLRRLEASEQEKVHSYVRELLEARQMEEDASASEEDIRAGSVKDYKQFKKRF